MGPGQLRGLVGCKGGWGGQMGGKGRRSWLLVGRGPKLVFGRDRF